MKNKSNISFPKRFIMSIKDIDRYNEFTEQKFINGFSYFSILLVIYTLIITISSVICLNYLKKDFVAEVEKLPDFKIENNKFSVDWSEDVINEDTYYFNNIFNLIFANELSNIEYDLKAKVVLSNNEAPEEIPEEYSKYEGFCMCVYSNKIMFFSMGNSMTYTYEELTNNYGLKEVINKKEFIDAINNVLNIRTFVSIFLGFLLTNYLSNLFNVITFALLGFILAKILGVKLSYGKVLNISFSAITLPLTIQVIYKIVKMLTGFRILHFDILFTIIAYLYIAATIYIMHKNNKVAMSKQKIKSEKEEIQDEIELEEIEEENQKEKEEVKKKDKETEKNRKRKEKTEDKEKPEPQANFRESQ